MFTVVRNASALWLALKKIELLRFCSSEEHNGQLDAKGKDEYKALRGSDIAFDFIMIIYGPCF